MFSKSSAKQGRAEDAMFITSPNLPLQNSDARSGHEFHLLFWVDLWVACVTDCLLALEPFPRSALFWSFWRKISTSPLYREETSAITGNQYHTLDVRQKAILAQTSAIRSSEPLSYISLGLKVSIFPLLLRWWTRIRGWRRWLWPR